MTTIEPLPRIVLRSLSHQSGTQNDFTVNRSRWSNPLASAVLYLWRSASFMFWCRTRRIDGPKPSSPFQRTALPKTQDTSDHCDG